MEEGQITHNPSTNQLLTRIVSSPSLQKLSSLAHSLSLGRQRRGSDSSSIGVASPRSAEGSLGGSWEEGPSGVPGWMDRDEGELAASRALDRNEMSFAEWRLKRNND